MQPNWKLLLGILMGLMITSCMPPPPAPAGKIYFDLKHNPTVLVSELGADIIVDEYNICYSIWGATPVISGWNPTGESGARVILTPGEHNIHIPSGTFVSSTGDCKQSIDKWKNLWMSAWRYRKSDDPNRMFAVSVDPNLAN